MIYALLALLLVATGVAVAVVLGVQIPFISDLFGNKNSQLGNMVSQQRSTGVRSGMGSVRSTQVMNEQGSEFSVKRTVTSTLTLEKKLKYAQWKMQPVIYRMCQIAISLFTFSLFYVKFNIVFQLFGLLVGPIFMGWLLNMAIERRFKAFDADYPSFLLSLVALLKTGMNAMGALESGAEGLEEDSMVRQEVMAMIDRLRMGVSEDKAIGCFGEDIHHPEIELFVQALLLSRRVGGTLSDTLERLAGQVRKRQFFRSSANAAVGMQRGSIWFILGIMVALESYLYFVYPEVVVGAIQDPMGWQVWQVALLLILTGMFWVRQVTKIRV